MCLRILIVVRSNGAAMFERCVVCNDHLVLLIYCQQVQGRQNKSYLGFNQSHTSVTDDAAQATVVGPIVVVAALATVR